MLEAREENSKKLEEEERAEDTKHKLILYAFDFFIINIFSNKIFFYNIFN
jgi:hypothetical protein